MCEIFSSGGSEALLFIGANLERRAWESRVMPDSGMKQKARPPGSFKKSPPCPNDTKKRHILDCAEAVFLKNGYQAASMSEIAHAVGGAKGTLYNYFSSKEALFEECVRRHSSVYGDPVQCEFDPSTGIRDHLF